MLILTQKDRFAKHLHGRDFIRHDGLGFPHLYISATEEIHGEDLGSFHGPEIAAVHASGDAMVPIHAFDRVRHPTRAGGGAMFLRKKMTLRHVVGVNERSRSIMHRHMGRSRSHLIQTVHHGLMTPFASGHDVGNFRLGPVRDPLSNEDGPLWPGNNDDLVNAGTRLESENGLCEHGLVIEQREKFIKPHAPTLASGDDDRGGRHRGLLGKFAHDKARQLLVVHCPGGLLLHRFHHGAHVLAGTGSEIGDDGINDNGNFVFGKLGREIAF